MNVKCCYVDNDADSTNKTVEELLANKQPDHLKQQQQQKIEQDTPTEQLEDKAKKEPPSSAVYQKPPKVPSNLEVSPVLGKKTMLCSMMGNFGM